MNSYTLRSTLDPMVHRFEARDDDEAREEAIDLVFAHMTVVLPRETGVRRAELDALAFFAIEEQGRSVHRGVAFMADGYATSMWADELLDRLTAIKQAAPADAARHATGYGGRYTVVTEVKRETGVVANSAITALHAAATLDIFDYQEEDGPGQELQPFAIYRESDGRLEEIGLRCYVEEFNHTTEELIRYGVVTRPIGLRAVEWFDPRNAAIGTVLEYAAHVLSKNGHDGWNDEASAVRYMVSQGILPEDTPAQISDMDADTVLRLVAWHVRGLEAWQLSTAGEIFRKMSHDLALEAAELQMESRGAAAVAEQIRILEVA